SAAHVDAGGRVLYRVFMQRQEDGEPIATTAERGLIFPEPETRSVRLVLEEGRTLMPDGAILEFDRLVVPRRFDAETGPFRPRGENAREMTQPELWSAMQATEGAEWRDFAVEFH